MSTIKDDFEQAQLSMAAYALDLTNGISGQAYITKLVNAGMSLTQASAIATNYSVVDQYSNTESGFSATVFRDSSGKTYFAIRGSEDIFSRAGAVDWLKADIADIGADGIAIHQGIELFNYLQRLKGQENESVPQYTYDKQNLAITSTSLTLTDDGALSTLQGTISVTGHSLGGHLAMMMGRMAPNLVNSVHTYNAPGFDTTLGQQNMRPLTSEGFFSELLNAGGFPVTGPIAAGWDIGKMTHIDVKSDVVHDIGTTPGAQQEIITESVNYPETDPQNPFTSHYIAPITDALAVYDLLATLDASQTVSQLNTISEAASSAPNESLENIINVLGEIFKVGDGVSMGDRNGLYRRIQDIKSNTLFNQSAGVVGIVSLAGFTPDAFAAAAPSDKGLLYALENLNPFAVVGDDGLYPAIEPDNYSDAYLLDRATLLEDQFIRATNDRPQTGVGSEFDGLGSYQGDFLHLIDEAANYDTRKYNSVPPDAEITIHFGRDDHDDSMVGTVGEDHQYGRDGDDILIQSVNGADDNEADYMEGGAGKDVYIAGGGDTVLDTDGIGTVVFNGYVLTQGLGGSGNYQTATGRFTYNLAGNILTVTDTVEAESIAIREYKNTDLGIDLIDAQPANQTQSVITLGRHDEDVESDNDIAIISGNSVDMVQTRGLIQGATPYTANPDPSVGDHYVFANAVDAVYTGTGEDSVTITDISNNAGIWYFGGSGDDAVLVLGNDDGSGANITGATLYGESGSDSLSGTYLADWVDGGSEHDYLSGRAGDDILLGDQGNDLIFGGKHQDDIQGGDNNDHLFGGAQADVLAGGNGNDALYGDTEIGTVVGASGAELGSLASWDGANEAYILYPADAWWHESPDPRVLDLPVTRDVAVNEVGDDILSGGDGNDAIYGGGGDDLVLGGNEVDQLFGEAGDDRLEGGAGGDWIWGDMYDQQYQLDNALIYSDYSAALDLTVNSIFREHRDPVDVVGKDTLYGGSGNDILYGGAGDDILYGGADNDRLEGGTGSDVYEFNVNWGRDVIKDEGDIDTIRFGAGIHAGDIRVAAHGSDLLLADQNGNEIRITGWYNGTQIEQVYFADNTSWTEADLAAAVLQQTGGDGDDALIGHANASNVLSGAAGDDQLIGGSMADVLGGGEGNDTLQGMGGDDQLIGGAGADTYFIGNEPGNVHLQDNAVDGSVNTVRFANGLRLSDITSIQSGEDLVLSWNALAGSATIDGYFSNTTAWKFEDSIGLSVPDADVVNPPQTYASIIDEERQAYQDRVYADLHNRIQSPAPVTGNVTITVPQSGTLPEPFFYMDSFGQQQVGDLTLPLASGGMSIAFGDRFKSETRVVVDEIKGTADSDWLQADAGITYQNYNQAVYLTLQNGIQVSDTSYETTIKDSSYTRPYFIPDTELTVSGDTYQNILRAQVNVSSETKTCFVIDAGAGNDVAGKQILTTYGSIASTYHDGSVLGNDYVNTPMSMKGGEGNDALYGGRDSDYINGGDGIDLLHGYGGDDVLVGGQDDDFLYGHGGADRYVFDLTQAGQDYVVDNGLFTEDDVIGYLLEGRGMSYSAAVELVRSADTSLIQQLKTEFPGVFADVHDTVRINANLSNVNVSWVAPDDEGRIGIEIQSKTNPDTLVTVLTRGPNDYLGFGIENYEFADVTLTQADVISILPAIPSIWPIEGTPGVDHLQGSDEADILVGKDGDDDLEGSGGDDVYLYNAGDGGDYILDYSATGQPGFDTVSLGLGINPVDVKASFLIEDDGSGEVYHSLYLYFGDTAMDRLWIDWDYAYDDGSQIIHESSTIEYLQFLSIDGGQVFDLAAIVQARQSELIDAYNQATPIVLLTPEVIADFDVTATVGLAGGEAAYHYATTGDVNVAPGAPVLNEITGTSAPETLSGTDNADRIDGRAGKDTIDGGSGNDTLIGGAGSDFLSGGAGNDTFLIDGTDRGYDSFDGGAGVDTVRGGDGDDTIRMDNFSAANGVEVIDGGPGLNVIAGTGASNTIDLSGTTVTHIAYLDSGAGKDTLIGTSAADTLIGGAGSDHLSGGDGDDTFLIDGADGGYDSFDGGAGVDTIQGGDADDTIRLDNFSAADGVEVIDGGQGVNIIAGTGASNTIDLSGTTVTNIAYIDSGAGKDTVIGAAAADTLFGGNGSDTLYGEAGNDVLDGGSGNDALHGGAGDDVYHFYRGARHDVIYQQESAGMPINAGNDTVLLGGGVDQTQLWFTRNQNDLEISIVGTNDTLAINNWYADDRYHVEKIELASGYTLLDSQVDLLVNAMAVFDTPAAGQLNFPLPMQEDLNPVLAVAWQSSAA